MSEPLKLSKVLGLERREGIPEFFDKPSLYTQGYNDVIDDIDNRKHDVKQLTRIIECFNSRLYKEHGAFVGFEPELAQEIINKIDVWVVKKT